MLRVTFQKADDGLPARGAVLLTVAEGGVLGPRGVALDKALGGAVRRALKGSAFSGKAESTLVLVAPGSGARTLSRLVLTGIGKPTEATALTLESAAGEGLAALKGGKEVEATWLPDLFEGLALSESDAAAHGALGAALRSWRFDVYRTQAKPESVGTLKTLAVMCADPAEAQARYAPLAHVAEGVAFARGLVTEPPNVLFPAALADRCLELTKHGVGVEVLDEKALRKLGMGALLGVAQGSMHAPRVVVLTWPGKARSGKLTRPLALVGKGVTFDTGGISLKPPAGMDAMKYDMAGAAAVIGAMRALAGRKAKAPVVGLIGLVENMPSGSAQRPGDVVKSLSGKTIEVLNTDAEGRLVLADLLTYAQERFKPRHIVDLATLTGAITVALGHEYAGLFANDDVLAERLTHAGVRTGENLWRLPMGKAYDKALDSPIADVQNMSSDKGAAGSISAAQFLGRFVHESQPWAHLDIAGTAWTSKDRPTCTKGATAFGVRLLDALAGDEA